MREAEAQLQALIRSTGSYSLGGVEGGRTSEGERTISHHHHHFPGSHLPNSASSSAFLFSHSTSSCEVGPNQHGSCLASRTEVPRTFQEREKNALFDASLIPKVVMAGDGGNGGGGGSGMSTRDPALDELEKARLRQWKAALRKERNKAAARRSNLNKKIFRDQLEKKSMELREVNFQLHQEIRELSRRLRHFRYIRSAIKHVCRTLPPPPLFSSSPLAMCPC